VLRGPEGNDVQLVWTKDESDGVRALPPGEYRLQTTRVERTTDGVHWFVSSTSKPLKPRRLEVGKTARFDVDAAVHFNGRVKRNGAELRLNFTITGADHRGRSVYKADRRVPVTYRVLTASGRVFAKGTMNYG